MKYIEKDPSITLAICSQNLKEKNYENALENAYSTDIVLYQYFEFISILIFFVYVTIVQSKKKL